MNHFLMCGAGKTWDVMVMARGPVLLWLLFAIGCAAPAVRLQTPRWHAAVHHRYTWVDAHCVDGAPVDLAQVGFSRELFVDPFGAGLMLTFDSHIEREGCSELMVWDAAPLGGDAFRFRAWPAVVLPKEATCGVLEHGFVDGRLVVEGDDLSLSVQRSAFCHGYDVRFRYRRVPARTLTDEELLRRYVALFNRRDAGALSRLFAEHATLVEPFSRSLTGAAVRHEGRRAIRRWFEQAFTGSHWSAMRLHGITAGPLPDSLVIDWDYIDSELPGPFTGRILFVIGDGQIYLAELQTTGPVVH